MEAQQVIEKILADAEAEAEKIVNQAGEKQAAEQGDADEKLAAYNEQTRSLAEKAANDEKAHLLAAARMTIAKERLAEKRKILEELFGQARARLQALPDEEYRGLMAKRMIEAVETGDEEIIVDRADSRIDMDLLKEVNRQLGPGYRGNLRFASSKDDLGGGGFVLRRGKIKTNVSLAVLLNHARKELEIELAKELFGD
ncbi:MAG TPA: V-type ATP synthase subunit E [Sedimentisphaerales bacterium]|nr:V-type ATP synthase subunit E [Sedimentisphaerales bacterium]